MILCNVSGTSKVGSETSPDSGLQGESLKGVAQTASLVLNCLEDLVLKKGIP